MKLQNPINILEFNEIQTNDLCNFSIIKKQAKYQIVIRSGEIFYVCQDCFKMMISVEAMLQEIN